MRDLNEQFGVTPQEEHAFISALMGVGADMPAQDARNRKRAHTRATLEQAYQQHIANRPEIANTLMDHRAARGNPAALRFWAPVGSSGQYVKFNLNHGEEPRVSVWVSPNALKFADGPHAGQNYDILHVLDQTLKPEMLDSQGDYAGEGARKVVFDKTPTLVTSPRWTKAVVGVPAGGLTPQLVDGFSHYVDGRALAFYGQSSDGEAALGSDATFPRPLLHGHHHLYHETEVPISHVMAHNFERDPLVAVPSWNELHGGPAVQTPNVTFANIGAHRFKPDWTKTVLYQGGRAIPFEYRTTPPIGPSAAEIRGLRGYQGSLQTLAQVRRGPYKTQNIRPSVPSPLTGDEISGIAETRLVGPQHQPPWWRK